MSSAQIANIVVDTQNKEATTKFIEAQTALADASASEAVSRTRVADMTVSKIMNEISNLNAENARLLQATRTLAEQAYNMNEQGKSQHFIREQLVSMIGKLNAETRLLELDAAAADKLDNMGREFGQLKPFVDVIVNILRTFKR